MKNFVRYLALLIWLPLGAFAQDSDKGGLEGLLENSLSSETLQVTVDGLSGALSSTATIDKLTFADPTGPWMVIEDAELNWTRSALLLGRVKVADLAAGRISVLRPPVGEEAPPELPSAEAEPFQFSLPELPVSIEIDRISAAEIILEAPVLGERIVAVLEGGFKLADGDGSVNLNLLRTDIEGTRLALSASFENETEELVVMLDAQGREDGLIARKSGIPGAPALDLSVVGRGVLSDFTADISFATADSTRLGGVVRLLASTPESGPPDRTIQAELSGDVRPLVTEDLQDFFGAETAINFETILAASGKIEVPRLHLQTEQLNLRTRLALSETMWPEKIALFARLEATPGQPVRLPVPGTPTELSSAYLNFSFDLEARSVWSAVVTVSDLQQGETELETLDLRGAGHLTLPETDGTGAVSGQLSGGLVGIALPDAALQQAAGDTVAFGTTFAWRKGDPLEINGAEVAAGDVALTLDGLFSNLAAGVDFDGAIGLNAPDLRRFGAITGQTALTGAVALDVTGQATLLSGIFDVEVDGTGSDLRTGIAEVDALLGGEAALAFSGARNTDGITIRQASVATQALDLQIAGGGSRAATDLTLTARLDNLARLVPDLPGPTEFSGTVRSSGNSFAVDGSGSGPAGLALDVSGTVEKDFSSADLSAQANTRLAIANPFINPRTASGGLNLDVRVNGPLGLESVSATATLADARVADPTIGFSLDQLGGTARLANSSLDLDFRGNGNRGGQVALGGSLGLTDAQVASLVVDITALQLAIQGALQTRVDGRIGLDGPLAGGAVLSGQINLDETELRIPDGGGAAGEIKGLRHVSTPASVRSTLARAGMLDQDTPVPSGGGAGPSLNLDLLINAPTRIFVRGFGLDAELGGSVEVTGTTNNPRPVGEFELIRGRMSILGQRLDLTEGEIQLSANLIPDIRFVAGTQSDEFEVSAVISGPADEPEVSFESTPSLPEDEVLSRLLFRSGVESLSALQAIQLANSLIAVRNGTGLGFFNALREEAGLDDLDLRTDDEGRTSLSLGKYISDDVYTNVDINDEGETDVNLNIELTDEVTARATAGTDNSSLGLFFERDY